MARLLSWTILITLAMMTNAYAEPISLTFSLLFGGSFLGGITVAGLGLAQIGLAAPAGGAVCLEGYFQ